MSTTGRMPCRAKTVTTLYLALAIPLEEIEHKLSFAQFRGYDLNGDGNRGDGPRAS